MEDDHWMGLELAMGNFLKKKITWLSLRYNVLQPTATRPAWRWWMLCVELRVDCRAH